MRKKTKAKTKPRPRSPAKLYTQKQWDELANAASTWREFGTTHYDEARVSKEECRRLDIALADLGKLMQKAVSDNNQLRAELRHHADVGRRLAADNAQYAEACKVMSEELYELRKPAKPMKSWFSRIHWRWGPIPLGSIS